MNNEFSILIQGPLNKISLGSIPEYQKYGKVILSYWNEDDESIIQGYDLSNVIITKNPLPEKKYFTTGPGHTFTYQITSIFHGLQKVETRFDIVEDSLNSLFRCFFCEKVYARDEVEIL